MNEELVKRLDEAMSFGTTGREALPNLLKDCKAALLASSETALSVPDGWKLVPVEPTADMIDAGGETPKMKIIDGYCSTAQLRGGFSEDRLAGPKSDCAIAQVYKAMLATAPSLVPSAIGMSASEKALRELLLAHADFDDGEGNKDASVLRGRIAVIRDILRGT